MEHPEYIYQSPHVYREEINQKDLLLTQNLVINQEEFSRKQLKKIKCKICKEILRFPIKKCSLCGGQACSYCFLEVLGERNKYQIQSGCILDEDQLQEHNLQNENIISIDAIQSYNKLSQLQRNQFSVLFILNQVKVRCPFGRQNDQLFENLKKQENGENEQHIQKIQKIKDEQNSYCAEILDYKDFYQHAKNCQFRILTCTKKNCGEFFLQSQREQHQQECNYQIIQCEFCKLENYRILIKNHQKAKICHKECAHCQKDVGIWHYQQHVNQECEARKIQCKGCKEIFSVQEFQIHEQKCQEREYICECKMTVKKKNQESHKKSLECHNKSMENLNLQLQSYDNFQNQIQLKLKSFGREIGQVQKDQQYFFEKLKEKQDKVKEQLTSLEELDLEKPLLQSYYTHAKIQKKTVKPFINALVEQLSFCDHSNNTKFFSDTQKTLG